MILQQIPIAIHLDTCDLKEIEAAASNPLISGLTTNPTLMRRAGVDDYAEFARHVLDIFPKPVSFEVTSEDDSEISRQAVKIASWRENVFVKIPCVKSTGEYNNGIINALISVGVKVNITAIVSLYQASRMLQNISPGEAILSVFAGRLADTGEEPYTHLLELKRKIYYYPGKKILWASVREPLNIRQAWDAGCDIITVPMAILKKAHQFYGMDPELLSVQTSTQFKLDSEAAGLTL